MDVTKRFGRVVAVDGVTVRVERGEFFTFLGPSGCGKTTLLRIVAGLETPERGRVVIDGRDVTNEPPYGRGTAMVFQSYALWPHMTVFENVAYGLRVRRLPREEVRRRVRDVLELVRLEGLEDRYPTQLSGGQQQRVALARALVVEPRVLLLDEPLSNLDARLRVEMREEIRRLQRRLGITAVYVTHDQEEAMVLSDRVAVMNSGRVVQVGTPEELYERPGSLFVATFLGKCNLLEGSVAEASEGYVTVESRGLRIRGVVPTGGTRPSPGDEVYAVFRPHSASLDGVSGDNVFSGRVVAVSYLGERLEVRVDVGPWEVLLFLPTDARVSVGTFVRLYVPPHRVLVYRRRAAAER